MDSADILQRIQEARRKVDEATAARIRTMTQQESFKKDLESYKATLRARDIEPAQLDALIEKVKEDLAAQLVELEGAITVTP